MFLIYTDRMFIEHSFGRVTEKVSEEQTEREVEGSQFFFFKINTIWRAEFSWWRRDVQFRFFEIFIN